VAGGLISAGTTYLDILPNMAGFTQKLTTEVEAATKNATNAASSQLSNFEQVGKVATAAVVAGFAVVAVAALTAADRFEVSRARLETALTNLGSSFEAVKPKVTGLDSTMEKLGFTNADTENSLARLLPAVKDTGKSIELMGLAADIARGRHMDLESATQLLVKVETGHVALLGRLGINTKDANGALISQEEAVKRLTAMYGGNASAYTQTFAGKVAILRTEAEDLAKNIGLALIPVIERVVGLLADGTTWLVQHRAAMAALGAVIATVVVPAMVLYLKTQAVAFADTVVMNALRLVSAVQSFGIALTGTNNLMVAFGAGAGVFAAVAAALAITVVEQQKSKDAASKWADQFVKSGATATDQVGRIKKEIADLSQQANIDATKSGVGRLNDWLFGKDQNEAQTRADALEKQLASIQDATKATAEAAKTVGPQYAAAAAAEGASADQMTAAAQKLKKAHDDLADSIGGAYTILGGDAEALRGKEDDLATGFNDATDASKQLKDGLDALIGVHVSAERAAIDYEQKIADLSQALLANKGNIDIHADAGRKDVSAILDVIDTLTKQAQSLTEEGATTQQVSAIMGDHINQLRGVLGAAGLTTTQIDALVQQYHLIPPKVDTIVTADTSQAVAALTTVQRQLYDFLSRVASAQNIPGPIVANIAKSAAGRIAYTPMVSTLAEEGPEVVIPLTDRSRAQELAQQSGLLDLLSAPGNAAPSSRVAAPASTAGHSHDIYIDGQLVGRTLAGHSSRAMNGRAMAYSGV
jgi:polyhydroxyalkanoate synthesis regulator phasin